MRWSAALVALMISAAGAGTSTGQYSPPATILEAESAPAAPGTPAVPEPLYARSRRFGLPIQLYNAPFQIAAVQMYVSTDQGSNWQLYGQQPPTAREFLFQTANDGEFWFASKTLDDRNVVRPAGATRVEQRIVVDTQQPVVEFNVEVGGAGEVRLSWRALDQNLDPKSLRLEYRAGVGIDWHPIADEVPSHETQRTNVDGQYVWWPQVTARAVELRLEVADLALNKSVATRRVLLPKIAGRPATEGDATRFVQKPVGGNSSVAEVSQGASGIPWPENNQLRVDPRATVATPTDTNAPAPPPTAPNSVPPNSPPGPGQFTAAPGTQEPAAGTGDSAAPNSSPARDARGTADDSSAWPEVPPGQALRMTTSPRFQLEYDIEATGQGEVSEIQLWGTQDGGRTWEKWNKDEDRQSPFEVQVEREGIYGFRVVVIAGNGMAGEVPRSGAPADLWVGVDSTPPVGEITSVIYGTGPRVGQLDIRWSVQDRKLGERPIGLSFSAQPAGPWTPIASGLPNEGQYFWKVDASVPTQVFLRLEIRDAAGNYGESVTREPINIDGLVPKAHIRDLRPK